MSRLIVAEPLYHGLRNATGELLLAIARVQALWLLRRKREAAAGFWRFTTRWESGGNTFDRLDASVREQLLQNAAVITREIMPGNSIAKSAERLRPSRLPPNLPITSLLGEQSNRWMHRMHRALTRDLPHLRTARLSNAGHGMHLDDPHEWLAAVEHALS